MDGRFEIHGPGGADFVSSRPLGVTGEGRFHVIVDRGELHIGRGSTWDPPRRFSERSIGHAVVHAERELVAFGFATEPAMCLVDGQGHELFRRFRTPPCGSTFPLAFSDDGCDLVVRNAAGRVDVLEIRDPVQPRLRASFDYQDQQIVSMSSRDRMALARHGNQGVTLLHLPTMRSVWLPTRRQFVSAIKLLADRLLVGTAYGQAWEVPLTGSLSWATS